LLLETGGLVLSAKVRPQLSRPAIRCTDIGQVSDQDSSAIGATDIDAINVVLQQKRSHELQAALSVGVAQVTRVPPIIFSGTRRNLRGVMGGDMFMRTENLLCFWVLVREADTLGEDVGLLFLLFDSCSATR
jgi:hypothetical protein